MIKTRVFPEHNYKGIHFNGKTIRVALDPKKPIEELKYPEFYDVCITHFCNANPLCKYCYQNSNQLVIHTENVVEKFKSFFGGLNENEKPFQLAIGGGEPTSHPDFIMLLKTSYNMGITPNYTTNGMWVTYEPSKIKELLNVTKQYCGGVAVSTHHHLKQYWEKAVDYYIKENIFTNLHVIIGDKKSIDDFKSIYNKYHGLVKYFVLLPLSAQGRSTKSFKNWDYFQKSINGNPTDIAFGANFYPYFKKHPNRFKVSLYEPEILSKYLDIETMKIYRSSFSNIPIEIKSNKWVEII